MRIPFFSNITLRQWITVYRHFQAKYCLIFKGRYALARIQFTLAHCHITEKRNPQPLCSKILKTCKC
jgi:hypothetical protein